MNIIIGIIHIKNSTMSAGRAVYYTYIYQIQISDNIFKSKYPRRTTCFRIICIYIANDQISNSIIKIDTSSSIISGIVIEIQII